MKKMLIEGINGSIEINSDFIYLIIKNENNNSEKEHIIWFEEIEDIIYRKPKRDKYGLLSIYLSTQNILLNKKIRYTILLDRLDEKSLNENKKIYEFIKIIISNKEVKVKEAIILDEEKTNQDEKPIEDIKEDIKEKQIEISIITNDEKEEIKENVIVNNSTIKVDNNIINEFEKKVDTIIEVNNNISYTNVENQEINNNETKIDLIEVSEDEIEKESFNEEIENNSSEIEDFKIDENDFEQDNEDSFANEEEYFYEEEYKEEQNNLRIKSIKDLQKKILKLEKELKKITYIDLVLNKHFENENERSKLDKLIIELKKTIEKLEQLKKELFKQEKNINENDFISLKDGNVITTNINDLEINDKKDLQKYLMIYKNSFNRVLEIEKDTYYLSKESERKRNELNISDQEYEEEINKFRNVKSNQELINNYIKKTKEDLSKVKWQIERTIEPHTKYKYVKKSISKQTKRLAGLTALNSLRPNRSRLSMMALSFFTCTSSIHDLFGYELKEVKYNEVIQKETLIGLDNIDTDKARTLINNSKEQINSILYECEKKYDKYPKFNELKNNLLKLKLDIEIEEKQLDNLEDKIYDYKKSPMIKTLKYNKD